MMCTAEAARLSLWSLELATRVRVRWEPRMVASLAWLGIAWLGEERGEERRGEERGEVGGKLN
jgi:hypothetical protein